jgi:ParB-like chromosome segregation protein Spo0J
MTVIQRNTSELKVHSLNILIYREHIDEDFKASIRSDGIQSPLTICKSSLPELNDFIVCGRRRWYMAKDLKLKVVPCIEWECEDQLEFERRLILDNVRNETTIEERARMYEELKRIETAIGERKRNATLKRGGKTPDPDVSEKTQRENIGENTKSRDKAAAEVGLKVSTAEKAIAVVHAADKLESEGNSEAAAEVRDTLNKGTIAAAVRKVAEVIAPASLPPTEDQQHSKDIDRLTAKLTGLLSQVEKFAGELFVAIDQKKKTSPAFANRHAKFANLLRKFGDTLDPCLQGAGVIETAWIATKKQVDYP